MFTRAPRGRRGTPPGAPAEGERPLARSPATLLDHSAALRVLVAEPEARTRLRLRELLGAAPDLIVSDLAADGPQATASLALRRPDFALVALDLPEVQGGLVERVGADAMPPFVALGSDLRSALHAFEIGAVDFLQRPIEAARLAVACERARDEVERRRAQEMRRELAKVAGLWTAPPRHHPPRRIIFRLPGRLLVFDASEIEWIEAAGNYAKVHSGGRSYLVRETLESVQSRLGPDRFVRLHRSALVNLDGIQELVYEGAGEISTVLKSGRRLPTSRSYRERLEAALLEE